MRTAQAAAAGLLLTLAACAAEPENPAAITAEEDRRLNEAAEMLDANSVTADLFENER